MSAVVDVERAPAARMGRAARAMGAATAVSRLLGFGRVLVIAAVLGTTDLGNTFSASNSVSNVLFDLLAAGALSAVLVPAFVGLLERRSADGPDPEDLAGALLGWSLLVLGPVCLAGVLAAPALARVLTTGTADPVVPFESMADAEAALRKNGVPVETLTCVGMGHAIDEEGLRRGGEFLLARFTSS